jgi:hypothetical protein
MTVEDPEGMEEEDDLKPNPAWKIAMVGVPVFLVLSTAWAIWGSWKKSQVEFVDPRLALVSSAADVEEMEDHLYKLSQLLGKRDWESSKGRTNMRRAITFIESTLSPRNYGFSIKRGEHLAHEGDRWPTVWVDLKGTVEPKEVVLVDASYDVSDAAVAVVLAVANDLRDEKLSKTVRFVFHPARLYFAQEGKDLGDVLEPDESHQATLQPDLPGESGVAPEPGRWNGAQLKPVADALAQKVRELAR